jgi:hypothetical protein
MSYQQQIPLMTKGHGDMLDITEPIATIVLGLIEHTHIIESERRPCWLNACVSVVLPVCRAPVSTVTGKTRRAVWRLLRNHRGLIPSIS